MSVQISSTITAEFFGSTNRLVLVRDNGVHTPETIISFTSQAEDKLRDLLNERAAQREAVTA